MIQFGVAEEDEFTTIEFGPPAPSSMISWPTPEEPNNYYKISSAWVTLRMDQNVTERQTYSFLEWLGDIGGLYDALRIIGALLLAPFSAFQLKAQLLSSVFRFTASRRFAEERTKNNSKAISLEDTYQS